MICCTLNHRRRSPDLSLRSISRWRRKTFWGIYLELQISFPPVLIAAEETNRVCVQGGLISKVAGSNSFKAAINLLFIKSTCCGVTTGTVFTSNGCMHDAPCKSVDKLYVALLICLVLRSPVSTYVLDTLHHSR